MPCGGTIDAQNHRQTKRSSNDNGKQIGPTHAKDGLWLGPYSMYMNRVGLVYDRTQG